MMHDNGFYNIFMQDIYARAGSEKDFCEEKFLEVMCEFLIDQAVIDSYESAFYKKTVQGIKIDAWGLDTEKQILNLFICDFSPETESRTLTQTDADKNFKRLERFFEKAITPGFYREIEESLPIYRVVRDIAENSSHISKVRLFLLSNGYLSSRFKGITNKLEGYEAVYDIWDMSRYQRISESGKAKEDIEINFTEFVEGGIAFLPAHVSTSLCESYLLALPGKLLAEIYDKYGDRLLEQNVRTFLQFRGGVNKGIKNTLINQPEMFFAYNNGLTVTAESTKTSGNQMLSVTNLQIVNGGQTTASIFMAKLQDKKNEIDLSKVYVQVKLSVINSEKVDDVVPVISKCANTQNKVSAADFFSNHPFHKRIEDFSRRTLAPSVKGELKETYWFYERTRGQYANKQSKMTSAEKNKFLNLNPRHQMFTKTDLAKYENSFAQFPHFVSKGAQWNFGKFAEEIGGKGNDGKGLWEKNDLQFNLLYYKQCIAKALVFNYLDKNLMKEPWYGGYKANIITYTIAKLSYHIAQEGKFFDFLRIWNQQDLSDVMKSRLLQLAKDINSLITDTEENVTSYCKKEYCWTKVKNFEYIIPSDMKEELVGSESISELKKDATRNQKILKGIEAQTAIYDKGLEYWTQLIDWAEKNKVLSPKEMSILSTTLRMNQIPPSEKQSEHILKIDRRAIEEGFYNNG